MNKIDFKLVIEKSARYLSIKVLFLHKVIITNKQFILLFYVIT